MCLRCLLDRPQSLLSGGVSICILVISSIDLHRRFWIIISGCAVYCHYVRSDIMSCAIPMDLLVTLFSCFWKLIVWSRIRFIFHTDARALADICGLNLSVVIGGCC